MSLRFLLDTNVLSEPVRPSPHPQVLPRLQEHRREIATAAPVWNELLYGWERLPASMPCAESRPIRDCSMQTKSAVS